MPTGHAVESGDEPQLRVVANEGLVGHRRRHVMRHWGLATRQGAATASIISIC